MSFARLDPSLPCVDLEVLRCPGCGQTYETITERFGCVPAAHYPRPTRTENHRLNRKFHVVVGTVERPRSLEPVCGWTDRDLMAWLYRSQRTAAGLGAP